MKVYPIFAWYDLWIGFFIDTKKKRVYFFPIPCFGLVIEWGEENDESSKKLHEEMAARVDAMSPEELDEEIRRVKRSKAHLDDVLKKRGLR